MDSFIDFIGIVYFVFQVAISLLVLRHLFIYAFSKAEHYDE